MKKNDYESKRSLFDFVGYIDLLEKYNKLSKIPVIKVLVEIKFKNQDEDDFFTISILTDKTLQLFGKIRMISKNEKNNLYNLILRSYQNNEFEKPIYGGREITEGSSFSYKINWDEVQHYETLKDQMSLGFTKMIDFMQVLINNEKKK
jgi:hypothetical protein